MFQSSRIASGMVPRQISSACSPSSASEMSNSSPSRMRRATLRMTLESSTTRQVFISILHSRPPLKHSQDVASRRRRRSVQFKNPIDIEDDQQLAVEPMHAGSDPCQPRIEID